MAGKNFLFVLMLALLNAAGFGQGSVPMGIHYQAVARDSYGKELISKDIDVRFSIISGNPLGTLVYQELHSDVTTSKYGVFSLIIGHGTPTGGIYGELSQVNWSQALHYLKVEVKFDNDFLDMGTMQFLSVPYALYAQKSLEPGPAGPKGDPGIKGDPGDPATDDQTLSFDETTLSISSGNSVPLSSLLQTLTINKTTEGNYLGISRGNSVLLSTIEADGDPTNEIQDLVISSDKLKITKNSLATEWDLSPYRQSISFDPVTRVMSISGTSGTVNLSELKDDADADPTNEIQDIQLSGDLLTITKNGASSGVSLNKYLDNTDAQTLTLNSTDNKLTISGGNSADLSKFVQSLSFNPANNQLSISSVATPVDLSSLKNDADADPANEIQDLNLTGNKLSITGKTNPSEINLSGYLDNTDSQTLSYSATDNSLAISGGNSVSLGSMVAFRAKNTSSDIATIASYPTMTYDALDYNVGNYLNTATGIFTAPADGIYTFNVAYNADGVGDGREVAIYVNSVLYEKLAISVGAGTTIPVRSVTMKLSATNTVNIVIYTGLATQTGTGTFSGYRVY
ncbi:MAG: complement C1q tumor necrosis factor-related protein [Bacteroidales bacterium]|nr:complement C1q tumor necrosis factor-related protein [Bacteroidales bacterium]